MMQSEFVELTGIYVSTKMYEEIEKVYYELNVSKQVFCKMYKSNKDGIAEAIAHRGSEQEWKQYDGEKQKAEIKRLKDELEKVRGDYKTLITRRNELLKNEQEASNKMADVFKENCDLKDAVKSKDFEILTLKAKLYDMMVKGAA